MINHYRLSLITPPAIEPVTLAEAKKHLRLTDTDEDALISSLIVVARQQAEVYTRRALITQTWSIAMDRFPPYDCPYRGISGVYPRHYGLYAPSYYGEPSIVIPKAPLQSVMSITYYDNDDNATVWPDENYQVTKYSGITPDYGAITPREGVIWPIVGRKKDGIEIEFIAGYGDDAFDIPQPIKQAILQQIAFLYVNRGDCSEMNDNSIVGMMLLPFKLFRL